MLMLDKRLEPVREKDAVISTYSTDTLITSPAIVESVYSTHASTHMSMGDTSIFEEKIIHWTRHNKGCVIGAIVGRYGYGKTSTAVHLWHECERNNVIAVPPFAWFGLTDIIGATYSWVNYRLEQLAPDYCQSLRLIYDRYCTQSLEILAKEEGTTIEVLKGLFDRGKLKLETRPPDVVKFLAEVNELVTKLGREGPVVFTDELQVTLSEYPTRDQFMDDLFGVLNELHHRQGSYGIVISMPTATETLIADVRQDIIDRMQGFNLYIRPETMYGRSFATDLWRKYAQVFGFVDSMSNILPPYTLKSIGEIASRQDLGAGPRTVVEAFRRAIAYYDKSNTTYLPTDLIDDYLNGEVAFDQNGKLGQVVREALGVAPVAGNTDNEFAIKLLGAFPEGCSEEIQHYYDAADAISELPPVYRREYLYDFAEGPSLRKLAATEVKPDPVFLRLAKEFIGRYKEDTYHGQLALTAFQELILHGQIFTERRGTSLTGWKWESQYELSGAFQESYPDRQLYLKAALAQEELDMDRSVAEFGIWLQFSLESGNQDPGQIRKLGGSKKAFLRLNGMRRPSVALNIAYLSDLGLPLTRLTPLFMLALHKFLDNNRNAIPSEEQVRNMKTFTDQLLSNAVKLLFHNELREQSEWALTLIGTDMVKDIFNQMCEATYPAYVTFITMRGWENHLNLYINALSNPRVTAAVAHGQQALTGAKDEVVRLFGQGSSQAFQNFQRSIPHLLELTNWAGREQGQIKLRLHPLEQAILDALDTSTVKTKVNGVLTGELAYDELNDLFRRQGYQTIELQQALRLLKARRYLKLDERKRKFARLIESPEELQHIISEKLEAIRNVLKLLDGSVGDFDITKYSSQVAMLARREERATGISELEEVHLAVNRLRNEVDHQIETHYQIYGDQIQKILDDTQRNLNSKLPARELIHHPLWLPHSQALQSIMESSTFRVSDVANELLESSKTLLDEARSAETPSARLVILYRGQQAIHTSYKKLKELRQKAFDNNEQFKVWKTLLEMAIRVKREVDNCAYTYSLPEFRDRFEALDHLVEHEIAAGRGFENLPRLRRELEKLERATQERISGQRDLFVALKIQRETLLNHLSGHSIHLHANFDHYHPIESQQNLEIEVGEHLERFMDELRGKLSRMKSDLSYLSLILKNPILPDTELVEQAEHELQESLKGGDIQMLELWAGRFQHTRMQIEFFQDQIASSFIKQAPSAEEGWLLSILSVNRTMELGEVVRHLIEKQGAQDFSLDQLVSDIQSLYQKNQIIIKLERRY